MRKTVTIGGKAIVLDNNASLLYKYKKEFGADAFADFNAIVNAIGGPLTEEVGLPVMRLTYIMAKNANKEIKPFEDWLEEIGTFPITLMPREVCELMSDTFELHNTKNSTAPEAEATGEN